MALEGFEGQHVLALEAWVIRADEEEMFQQKALSGRSVQGLAGLEGSTPYVNSPCTFIGKGYHPGKASCAWPRAAHHPLHHTLVEAPRGLTQLGFLLLWCMVCSAPTPPPR